MADDGIRERHGMAVTQHGFTSRLFVAVQEYESEVVLIGCSHDRAMSPAQARYLARKLYRLARRIEQRGQQP